MALSFNSFENIAKDSQEVLEQHTSYFKDQITYMPSFSKVVKENKYQKNNQIPEDDIENDDKVSEDDKAVEFFNNSIEQDSSKVNIFMGCFAYDNLHGLPMSRYGSENAPSIFNKNLKATSYCSTNNSVLNIVN